MTLHSDDWIFAGPGQIYDGVSLGSHLLYRLFDQGISLLVSHGDLISSSISTSSDDLIHTIDCCSVVHKLKTVHVNVSTSVEADLEELLRAPGYSFNIDESSTVSKPINAITTLSIKPWRLPIGRMFNFYIPSEASYSYWIENTEYCVQSRGAKIQKAVHVQMAHMKCFKVSVINKRTKEPYGLKTKSGWSLSAWGGASGGRLKLAKRASNEKP